MPDSTRTMRDADFAAIRAQVHARTGIHLPSDLRSVAERALAPRLEALSLDSFDAYARYLTVGHVQAGELAEVLDALGITESWFFRDTEQLAHFERAALPALIAARAHSKHLRLLSAGCASGEEPYTLAILAHRALGVRALDWRIEILGVDLSDRALTRAHAATYTDRALRAVDAETRSKHFIARADRWEFDPHLRESVAFTPLNLRNAPALRRLGRFDAVFCRHTLTTCDAPSRADIIQSFRYLLAEDASLFLGEGDIPTPSGLEGLTPDPNPTARAWIPADPFRFRASA